MQQFSISFVKGTKTDGVVFRDALPLNCIYVPKPEQPYLTTYPGLTKFASGIGADRGGIYFESDILKGHFRVSGNKLIEVVQGDLGPEVIELGDIPGDDQVTMLYTLSNLVVTANRQQFLYNRNDGFREVTDSDLGEPIDSTWINAKIYDLSYDSVTGTTFIVQHEINDDGNVSGAKYSTSDISPDVPYAIQYVTGNQVAVFNRHTIEFFYDTENTGFSLERQQSRTIDCGIVGTHCVCRYAGTFALLGGRFDSSLNIYVISGAAVKAIGTNEVQLILAQYTETELREAKLESRSENGHEFLICHLPNHSLLYDGATSTWTRLESGVEGATYRGINGVFDPRYQGNWLYGDRRSSDIGKLTNKQFKQYEQSQRMEFYSPWIVCNGQTLSSFEMFPIPGRVSNGESSRLFLSATQDGQTYGKEKPLNIGERGNYRKRLTLNNLGTPKSRVSFRLRYVSTDPFSIGSEAQCLIS